MADIFKLQGSIEVNTGKAEASLKKVESAARGTEQHLSRIGQNSRRAGSELAGGFDRGAHSASRLMNTVNALQSKIRSLRGASLNFAAAGAGGALRSAGGAFAGLGTEIVTGAISKLTSGMSAAITTGIEFNKMMEGASVVFENLTGSAEGAQKHLNALKDFAKSSPFDMPDLIQASAKLQAFGFTAESIVPNLDKIQNAAALAAGTSGDFTDSLQGIVAALGKMKSAGRAGAQEFDMLTERGIPAWDLIAKKIGMTVGEVRKLSEAGKLKGTPVAEALIESFGEGKFAGLGQKISKTALGRESNLRDMLTQQAGAAGKDTFEAYKSGLEAAIGVAGSSKALDLGKAINSPVTAGLELGSDIATGQTTLKDIGRALPQTAVDTVQSLGSILKDGIVGAWQGAKELATGVAESAGTESGQALVKGTKDSLDMHSPSKVMMQLGEDAITGFSMGWEAGKKKLSNSPPINTEEMKKQIVAELERLRNDPQVKALLDTIAKAEGANYNTLFGGGTFSDFSQHPNQRITRKLGGKDITSTAAGRYQILKRTNDAVEAQTGITGFDQRAQDLKGIYLAKQRGMLDPLFKGDIAGAFTKGNREWASLPGSPYGQPTKKAEDLLTVYNAALEKYNGLMADSSSAMGIFSAAIENFKMQVGSAAASLANLTGIGVVAKPVPAPIASAPIAPTVQQSRQSQTVSGGAVGSVEVKAKAEALTLSKDAETASSAIAKMSVPMKELPKSAVETAGAMQTATKSTEEWRAAIIDSAEKTGQAAKAITDHFASFKDAFARGIDDIFDGNFSFKSFGKSLLKSLGSGLISQATGGKASSPGEFLSKALFGGLGGGSGASGGGGQYMATGGFAGGPGAGAILGGGSSGGGGIGGALSTAQNIGGLFNKGGLLSKLPGVGKLGGFLGKIPGLSKLGSLFGFGGGGGAAAGGAAAGGGAAGAGGMAALFSNPITAIIGGALFAAPLIGKLFGKDPLSDYRKHIKSIYGVDIKSKSLLSAVMQAGQSKFGAEWEKRKVETVRLPEVRDRIHEYAQAHGKAGNQSLFSGAEFSDQFSAVNQFKVGFRAHGGPVTAGMPYIVGERGAELFIPNSSGRIAPNGGNRGGIIPKEIYEVLARLSESLDRFEAMPAEHVVMTGLDRNPDAAAIAFDKSASRRSEASRRVFEKMQVR